MKLNQRAEKAKKGIDAIFTREWMNRESVTRWVGIQRIKAKFAAGTLTGRQLDYWAAPARLLEMGSEIIVVGAK